MVDSECDGGLGGAEGAEVAAVLAEEGHEVGVAGQVRHGQFHAVVGGDGGEDEALWRRDLAQTLAAGVRHMLTGVEEDGFAPRPPGDGVVYRALVVARGADAGHIHHVGVQVFVKQAEERLAGVHDAEGGGVGVEWRVAQLVGLPGFGPPLEDGLMLVVVVQTESLSFGIARQVGVAGSAVLCGVRWHQDRIA